MNGEVLYHLERLEKETGLERKKIVEVLKSALKEAAQKKYGQEKEIKVLFDEGKGNIQILVEGRGVSVGNLGRLAVLRARQVIMEKIKEAERELVYNAFKGREGEIVHGVVERREGRNFIVEVEGKETLLPSREALPQDTLAQGERLRAYILEVRENAEYPVILSRTHPEFLKKLLEIEVPEIREGIVKVISVVREPGYRAKVAVESRKEKIDSVGACVGLKGSRIKAVTQELRGEKIDIIPYSKEPEKFISNSLAPAQVKEIILFPEDKRARVIVEDEQLSLAIGKKGQNVSLAARLTGWSLDVRSLTQAEEEKKLSKKEIVKNLSRISGINSSQAERLFRSGFVNVEDVSRARREDLTAILKVSEEEAKRIINEAKELLKKEGMKIG